MYNKNNFHNKKNQINKKSNNNKNKKKENFYGKIYDMISVRCSEKNLNFHTCIAIK